MADGLTVPFALAAGLTGAVDSSHIIVVAGLAEIAAGSIAMGLAGYLAARSDEDHYVRGRAARGAAALKFRHGGPDRHRTVEVVCPHDSYNRSDARACPLDS